ncbi:MAG: hypothetical protein EP298_01240 [Gammaproteobacteria bacterium]|nr:MAG: hypothetical protein EP298_01240 [Gammaproteobacteria bacterium]UTW41975.1 hypothetical protein KFE69_10750 [bacterium SCSIO 12844]
MKKAKLTYLLSLLILIVLIVLEYTITLPFNSYILTLIFLFLALISGFSLCTISEKYFEKNKDKQSNDSDNLTS